MGKRKAEKSLEREFEYEDNTAEVEWAATTETFPTVSMRSEPPAEGATRESSATSVAVPVSHVDYAGADLFWTLLENAGYTVW